jgi:tetratricopeptide (TPR) repeat protein
MTPFRMVGLVVTVFATSLPVVFLLHEGPSAWLPSSTDSQGEQQKEEKDDPVVDILCLKAMEQMSNGNFTQAIATYNKAIERDPKYSFAYIGRGDAYRASGDLDRAVYDYDQATRVDPNSPIGRESRRCAQGESKEVEQQGTTTLERGGAVSSSREVSFCSPP